MVSSTWDGFAKILDETCDEKLGDRLELSLSGGPFVVVPGYVLDEVEGESSSGAFDEVLGERQRVKIRKDLMPVPSQSHRIRHARLGAGTYRPSGALPATQGRYWVFDVQKAT